MLPLKDNIPTSRFPVLTVLLIVVNVAVFAYQVTLPDDRASSPELAAAGIAESDEFVISYGAIPYRITHPGEECRIVYPAQRAPVATDIACTHRQAAAAEERIQSAGAPAETIRLDGPAWWATLLTSMFMHGGLLHIAGNMLFLWVFGNNIEDSMGRLRFLLFYLLAGLVAVYAQAVMDPAATVPTIGASGAVAGVLGAYILLHPRARVLSLVFVVFFVTLIEVPAMILLGLWFVLQAIPAVGQVALPDVTGDTGGVAYLAHVGGFVFGLLAIKLFADRHRRGEAGGPRPPYPVY